MKKLRVVLILLFLVLCAAPPAAADLTFNYTSGATFTGTGDLNCTGNNGETVGFICAPYALSAYGSETLTLGQTAYYYLGSMQDNEGDLDSDEDDAATFQIQFDTSVTTPFTLTIPVTFSYAAQTGVFNATGVSQLLNAGGDNVLLSQVRITATAPSPASPTAALATCPSCASSYTYDINDANATRYYYLMLTYNTPEPATYILIGSALVGLAFLRRRRA